MALIEKQIVFKRKSGEDVEMHLPTTKIDYVEGGIKTVNGIAADANKNVTIDVGVTSFNGSTGAITLDLSQYENKVTSVNGATGDITINDYITGMTVSGNVITYTRKNATSGKVTVTSYPNVYVSGSVSGTITLPSGGTWKGIWYEEASDGDYSGCNTFTKAGGSSFARASGANLHCIMAIRTA